MRVLALFALLAVAGCSSIDDGVPISPGGGRACTLVGCANGAQLSIRVETTREILLGSTIELCRNEQCSRATPTSLPDSPGGGTGGPLFGPVSGTFTVWGPSGAWFPIDVRVNGSGAYPYGLVDGDRYVLRVIASNGDKLAETSATVTYTESYPNGKECDRYACRQASHDGGDFPSK